MTLSRIFHPLCLATLAAVQCLAGDLPSQSFFNFESGHVRPLCVSRSGSLLFAVNTPDNRVEVFQAIEGQLRRRGEVMVGLDPVAIALLSEREIVVVNHLSDSVSIVDVSDPDRPFVKETLLVGDEPRDVVVAGSRRNKICISTAARGQSRPRDSSLSTQGIGRADIWVFNSEQLTAPPKIITLFCDSVRALAVSPDGRRVHAAAFLSGNGTTAIPAPAADPTSAQALGDGFSPPPATPPTEDSDGRRAPGTAVMVRWNGTQWLDNARRDWTPRMRYRLPDFDLFTLDTDAEEPSVVAKASGVGTVLFALAVSPTTGAVYVSNLESRNLVRFEPELRGHLVDNRITIVESSSLESVSLNPHIRYEFPEGTREEFDLSLALPVSMEITRDGSRLYVAAMGSGMVGVLDNGGQVLRRIPVGGNPTGLTLHEASRRLYVMDRFIHTILVYDLDTENLVEAMPLRYTPEPERVRRGRPYLYDARSSAHSDAACGSCHIFGDTDGLAWDLGDPFGSLRESLLAPASVDKAQLLYHHPMKGAMTTQSLRGLAGAGPMHWRGDRTGGKNAVQDAGLAFLSFRESFQTLLGRATEISTDDMGKLRDFVLSLRYPPNPIAPLDGSLSPAAARGRRTFLSSGDRGGIGGDGQSCASCHVLPLGTDGRGAVRSGQTFKVPHLRNLYSKVGMFGSPLPRTRGAAQSHPFSAPTEFLGDQVRGFGFSHDGSVPTIVNFLLQPSSPLVFPDEPGRSAVEKACDLEAFLLSFPTGLAPAVGQQVTLNRSTWTQSMARFDLLESRAAAGDGDLVLHGLHQGEARGWVRSRVRGRIAYLSNRLGEQTTLDDLRESVLHRGSVLTATLVPPGSGRRIGIDRDEDGFLDQDELDSKLDPASPRSHPHEVPASNLPGDFNGNGRHDYNDVRLAVEAILRGEELQTCWAPTDKDPDITDLLLLLCRIVGVHATSPLSGSQ